jgi:hypothetical protein
MRKPLSDYRLPSLPVANTARAVDATHRPRSRAPFWLSANEQALRHEIGAFSSLTSIRIESVDDSKPWWAWGFTIDAK